MKNRQVTSRLRTNRTGDKNADVLALIIPWSNIA
jgi:hypothetical protein